MLILSINKHIYNSTLCTQHFRHHTSMIETENFIYKICGNRMIFSNNFNEPIISYKLTGPLKTQTVIYRKKHNKTLRIPQNITHMIFDYRYNKRIIVPPNISCLTLGNYKSKFEFNNGLIELTLGKYFNNQVVLPREIKKLTLGDYFNNVLKLNRGIRELKFGHDFNRKISLNPCMRKILFGMCYDCPLTINTNLRVLIFGHTFNKPIELNKKLEILCLESGFFHNVRLSKRLLGLSLHSVGNNHYFVLPKYLKRLVLGRKIFGTSHFNKRLCLLSLIGKWGFFMSVGKHSIGTGTNDDVFSLIAYEEFEHSMRCDNTQYVFGNAFYHYDSNIVHVIEDLPNGVNHITLCEKQRVILNNIPSSLSMSNIKIISQTERKNLMNTNTFV